MVFMLSEPDLFGGSKGEALIFKYSLLFSAFNHSFDIIFVFRK